MSAEFWRGRRVFVTGDMGFKGAWLVSLLGHLGAVSHGFGRDERRPLLYPLLDIETHAHRDGDIRETAALAATLLAVAPEIVIHLAAQPIVLESYSNPQETFSANILGTASVLDACRGIETIKAIVVVTSDKVYENRGWAWGYREDDVLGGLDPYSASKAAAEIVTRSMASSYFHSPGSARIATARAGNVIGGGDWAEYRLLPDAARAFANGDLLICRNPGSTRPWQHVLDPLWGYLTLARAACEERVERFSSWNFGPSEDSLSVGQVADIFAATWGGGASWQSQPDEAAKPEARYLAVDTTRARSILGWKPRWSAAEAVSRTAVWYRDHGNGTAASPLVQRDLVDFLTPL